MWGGSFRNNGFGVGHVDIAITSLKGVSLTFYAYQL